MNDEELTPNEIEELGLVMEGLADYEHNLEAPPEFVWDAIEADLDADEVGSSITMGSTPHDYVDNNPAPQRGIGKYVAVAAVVVIAAFGLSNLFGSSPEEVLVASAAISNEGMPLESPASGTATLVSVDGVLQLDVDIEQLETDTGYFELWVATADASEVRSLGAIDSDGRFELPDDFDADVYPAVAISLEANDGDPSFGGVAVLFGVLDR